MRATPQRTFCRPTVKNTLRSASKRSHSWSSATDGFVAVAAVVPTASRRRARAAVASIAPGRVGSNCRRASAKARTRSFGRASRYASRIERHRQADVLELLVGRERGLRASCRGCRRSSAGSAVSSWVSKRLRTGPEPSCSASRSAPVLPRRLRPRARSAPAATARPPRRRPRRRPPNIDCSSGRSWPSTGAATSTVTHTHALMLRTPLPVAQRLFDSSQALVNMLASRFDRSTDLISTSVEFAFSTSSKMRISPGNHTSLFFDSEKSLFHFG